MDIIDFRYRPPYGSYRETIMYRDLERAKRCSEAFGMNQSPAVAARDMEASLTEMDRADLGEVQPRWLSMSTLIRLILPDFR